jgi:hypothetical protein
MHKYFFAFSVFLFSWTAFAQGDRGAITGTISDPAGAMIPGATITARNSQTGASYQAASTATGNYTLPQLPTGTYQLSASVPGFKQFVRTGITVLVAQTLRIDIKLEVGDINETVTVNADAPLLRTESGELSHTVAGDRLNDLPILSLSSGMRDPYDVAKLIPGTVKQGNNIRVNGAMTSTHTIRIEGQDSNTGLDTSFNYVASPSVDSIEEFAIQTSNFAAEFGQVGGGLFNITMKSGSNTLHGSAYDYFSNESLNAAQGYINRKPRDRKNDYGFTLGGPVYIPKIYDGREKTFFFFNFEQYRTVTTYVTPNTVPTVAFRNGDFRSILTGKQLGVDPLGRPIMENAIYDPATERVVNGQVVRDTFPDNTIPIDRFDPVAAAIQALIPAPTNSLVTNNYVPNFDIPNVKTVPAVKIDHSFSAAIKLSGYWSEAFTYTDYGRTDGILWPGTFGYQHTIWTHTIRLNYDHTLNPTMLLHFGAGMMYGNWRQEQPPFDNEKEIGLKGTTADFFPVISGLYAPLGGYGRSSTARMGAEQLYSIYDEKPTTNASLNWVRQNHTFKFGAELRLVGNPMYLIWPANGAFTFDRPQSGLPSTFGQDLKGGNVGYPWASFLLGATIDGAAGVKSETRMGKAAWSFFAQDTWKVTPKFTLDYGLRWDWQEYLKEHHGRVPSFTADVLNPSAGNLPGAVVFEQTYGDFAKIYPYAFGPRLGAAYQITPKTVLRAGWGISYGQTAANEFWSMRFGSNVAYGAPAYGAPAMLLKDGVPIQPTWPDFDPGQQPSIPASPSYFLTMFDPGAGRPPRLMQWSIGIQREISPNLVVEATYVGNRGVWWQANAISDPNRLTPDILARNNLDISKEEDRKLLRSPLNSALAISRGFGTPPYEGFSLNLPVNQALRPYPHFTALNVLWNPVGNTWYDALQIKVTKRYSYGLSLTGVYSWQKELNLGANEVADQHGVFPGINNTLDRPVNKYISLYSQPHRLVVAANYTVPVWNTNKILSWALRDWTIGTVLQYASGQPIQAPYANNEMGKLLQLSTPMNFSVGANLVGTGTYANRVPGEPYFTQDLNGGNVDPNSDFVLNPKAWSDPAPGQWGTSAAYLDDYRYQRRPSESMSLGRTFALAEKASLNIRVEFQNIFNRLEMNNPTSTNAAATQVIKNGKPTSGFGYINPGSLAMSPRTGQIVARFQF